MKKSDLRTGMMLKMANGEYTVVYKNTCFNDDFVSSHTLGCSDWASFNDFDDDLNYLHGDDWHVMEVLKPDGQYKAGTADRSFYTSIWQRPTTHQITIDGKSIEISEESFQKLKRTLVEN